MKKLFLIALLSLTTLIGYSQTNFHQTISLSSLQDTTCGGEFSLISVSPEADSSTISSHIGNFMYNPPFGVPVTYTIHAEGVCGCVFDTTFTETLDSTQQWGFHVFQIEGSGFYGVSWTDCSDVVGVEELSVSKKLIKVLDETGRDAAPTPNRFYIYVYDDGSREKRMVVE